MVEFHGWFSIQESVDGENEENISSIVDELDQAVASLGSGSSLIDIRPVNGKYYLHLGGSTNHRSEDVREVQGLVNLVSSLAKGSYGILYLRDDEDSEGRDNEFQIIKMARGQIYEEKDVWLSPCNPTIEE
ncbi:Imm7 family immunity protein [Ekhidna sp.]|uniref:Imm7 family immunity protein n=1 Tax=Ekhidna sp. TaxID=2608089 RepID=UPI003BA9BDB3